MRSDPKLNPILVAPPPGTGAGFYKRVTIQTVGMRQTGSEDKETERL
jgi:hypothetical protein